MVEAIRGNVLAMVAEMESKLNDSAQKAQSKDEQEEMMKRLIAQIVEDIENNSPGRTGLDALQNFLRRLSTSDLGAGINDYIEGKLDDVKNYKPDQSLQDQLEKDESILKGLTISAVFMWWLFALVAVYQKKVDADKEAIKNDPTIFLYLHMLSTEDKAVISQADQKLSLGKANMKNALAVQDTIGSMSKLFRSA